MVLENLTLEDLRIVLSILGGVAFIPFFAFYVAGVIKNEIPRTPLTWAGFSLLSGSGLVSQILYGDVKWWMVAILTASAAGCLSIFSISMRRAKVDWLDIISFTLGIVVFVSLFIIKDDWLTIRFSVLANLLVGIPLLYWAVKKPKEYAAKAWNWGTLASFLGFMGVIGLDWGTMLFPFYLFLYNLWMFYFANIRAKFLNRAP